MKLRASFPTLAGLRRCWTFAYAHGLEEKLDFNIVGNPIESMGLEYLPTFNGKCR